MKSLNEMLHPMPKAKAKGKPRMSLGQKAERKIKRTMRKVTLTAVMVPVVVVAGQSLTHKIFSNKA